jgi:hypothetical protein
MTGYRESLSFEPLEENVSMANGREEKLAGGFDWRSFTPEDSPKGLPDVVAEMAHLSNADLETGDLAFDFELPVFDFSDGTRRASGATFKLSVASAERPVALIFGSYT